MRFPCYGIFRLTAADSGGDTLRRRSRPSPRQQLLEAIDGVHADAGDDITQVGLGLDAVELASANERVEKGRSLASSPETFGLLFAPLPHVVN